MGRKHNQLPRGGSKRPLRLRLGRLLAGMRSVTRGRASRRLRFEPLEDRRLLTTGSPTINEFGLPAPIAGPLSSGVNHIATGPDGTMWFTEQTQFVNNVMQPPRIGKITPAGVATEYFVKNDDGVTNVSSGFPGGIAVAPDGQVWFTAGSDIVKYDPSATDVTKQFKHYTIPGFGSATALVIVSDQGLANFAIYFTDQYNNAIGRIAADGSINEFPIEPGVTLQPHALSPFDIAEGPDGNIWFTEQSANKIGRMSLSGDVTEFFIQHSNSQPEGITAGPDGTLWFTEENSQIIGRITPAGKDSGGAITIKEYQLFSGIVSPTGIVTGPDHNLWFTEATGQQIGKIDPSTGEIAEYSLPSASQSPAGITVGADGNIWFTESHFHFANPNDFSSGIYDGHIGQAIVATNTNPSVDVEIKDPDTHSPVKPGDPVTVHLTVTNKDQNHPVSLTVYDPIPAGVGFTSFQSDRGTADVTNGLGTVHIDNLEAFGTVHITLQVTAGGVGQIVNRAYAVSNSPDPVSGNNVVITSVTVQPPTTSFVFGGAFTVNGVLNDPLKIDPNTGASTTGKFNWALSRTGGDPPQNVVVSMTVPAALTDVAAYPPNIFSYNSNTRLLTFAFSTIASQDTVNFGFTARPTAAGDITVAATVADDGVITGVPSIGNPPLPGKALTAHVLASATSASLSGVLVGDATGSPMEFNTATSTASTSGLFGWQLKNTGETTITGASVTIPLAGQPLTNIIPAAYIDSIFSPVGNASYNSTTKTITISGLPNIPPNAKPIRFGFLADPTGTGPVSVTATVTISGNLSGTNPPSNSLISTVHTTIEQPNVSLSLDSDLSVINGSATASSASIASVLGGPVLAAATSGGSLSGDVNLMTINASTGNVDKSGQFDWELKNTGNGDARNVTVTIPIPQDKLTNVGKFYLQSGGTDLNADKVYNGGVLTITFKFVLAAHTGDVHFGFSADPKRIGDVKVTATINVPPPQDLVGSGPLQATIETVVLSSETHLLTLKDGLNPGPVIPNANIVPIFYGRQWLKPDASQGQSWLDVSGFPAQLDTAMGKIVGGPYMDFLSQYSTSKQKIGRGTIQQGLIYNAATADGTLPAALNDVGATSPLKAFLTSQVANYSASHGGALPDPNNTLYVIYTPPGTVVTKSSGSSRSSDPTGFIAYHDFDIVNNTVNGVTTSYKYYYIMMPYESSPNGVVLKPDPSGAASLNGTTIAFSHELAEAVTDPDITTGWRDYSFKGANEIGDLVAYKKLNDGAEGNTSFSGMLDGVEVQYEWANTYTFPGTDYTVTEQPVLPQDGNSPTLQIKKLVNTFYKKVIQISALDAGYSYSGLIGSFQDSSNSTNDPSTYTVEIDWGDNTTSAGTVAYDPNLKQFLISGSHNFDALAGDTATISVSVVNSVTGAMTSFSDNVTLQQSSADAAQVQFDQSTIDAYRNGSKAVITVDRVGDATLGATVDYHVSGGTAVDGTDYLAVAGTLTFAPGDTSATILLPIYSNPAASGDLTVNLMISTPTGNTVLGTQATTTVTIHPSDQVFAPPAPVLDSDTGQYVNDSITSGNGSAAAPLTFKVTGASVRNGYFQLVDVTDPDNPVLLGDAVQATNGNATITLDDDALTDGTHQIAVINSVGLTAGARRASQATQITIDSVTPTSSLTGVPAFTKLLSLPVSWSGGDNAGGTGLQGYNISVSVDGADAQPWLTNTTDTAATFAATLGHSYAFFSAGVDVAGNVEAAHALADATVVVTGTPWHNPDSGRGFDVTDDGHIVADDVITIINYINAHAISDLPPSILKRLPATFIDVDGDNKATATDVVDVINVINSHHGGGEAAEGEAVSQSPLMMTVPQVSTDMPADLLFLLAADVASSSSPRRVTSVR